MSEQAKRATLSVAIITFNEEENIGRTLASVKDIADEIIVVDSGSTDRTIEIAKQFGAKVFVEEWKGFAAQKNSALDKCTSDWILSLDADEEVGSGMREAILRILGPDENDYRLADGISFPRINLFLGKRITHGGFREQKVRMCERGKGKFKDVAVHEVLLVKGAVVRAERDFDLFPELCLIHHQYPALTSYIEHMNRYSSLGAQMVVDKRGRVGFPLINIVLRPIATFIYNYFFRLGFLDGKEGLLLHLYHSVYVSWKYAKAWEISRQRSARTRP